MDIVTACQQFVEQHGFWSLLLLQAATLLAVALRRWAEYHSPPPNTSSVGGRWQSIASAILSSGNAQKARKTRRRRNAPPSPGQSPKEQSDGLSQVDPPPVVSPVERFIQSSGADYPRELVPQSSPPLVREPAADPAHSGRAAGAPASGHDDPARAGDGRRLAGKGEILAP